MAKRQPLQWCQSLRYLNPNDKNDHVAIALLRYRRRRRRRGGHKTQQRFTNNMAILSGGGGAGSTRFDDKFVEPTSYGGGGLNDNEFKVNYEKLWPKNTPNQNKFKMAALEEDWPRNLIALASFPGSGNTWLRYLLQQATGIYTGSVYKDFGLLKSGFPAENIFNSSVSMRAVYTAISIYQLIFIYM